MTFLLLQWLFARIATFGKCKPGFLPNDAINTGVILPCLHRCGMQCPTLERIPTSKQLGCKRTFVEMEFSTFHKKKPRMTWITSHDSFSCFAKVSFCFIRCDWSVTCLVWDFRSNTSENRNGSPFWHPQAWQQLDQWLEACSSETNRLGLLALFVKWLVKRKLPTQCSRKWAVIRSKLILNGAIL